MNNSCPICKSVVYKHVFSLFDDRYGFPGNFEVVHCGNCAHFFILNPPNESLLSNIYTQYYPRKDFNIKNVNLNLSKEHSGFNDWLGGVCGAYKHVPENVRILDIGCGTCDSLLYHSQRGCDAYGVETDKNVSKIAKHFKLNVKIGLFDKHNYELSYFDYVTMEQVLEHCIDPVKILTDISEILSPGGRLILTTPNPYSFLAWLFKKKWINWHVPYHVNLFSKKSLYLLAKTTGYNVKKIKTITSSKWLYYQLIHCLYYPKYCSPSLFWTHAVLIGHPLITRIIDMLKYRKILDLIMRLLDFLNCGCSYLIVLEKNYKSF